MTDTPACSHSASNRFAKAAMSPAEFSSPVMTLYMGSMITTSALNLRALRTSFGSSFAIGSVFPRRFHTPTLSACARFSPRVLSSSPYTSENLFLKDLRSTSRFT